MDWFLETYLANHEKSRGGKYSKFKYEFEHFEKCYWCFLWYFPGCMQKIVTYPHHYVNTFAWIVERRRCMQQIHTPSFFRFCSSLSYVCAVHDTTLTIAICSGRREADPVLGTGTVSSTLFRPSVLVVLVLRFRLCVRNENSVSLRDRYVRTTTSSRL